MTIRFLWNGIKVDGGKLRPVWYSMGALVNYPEGTVTIYARNYGRQIPRIEGLNVTNDTELQSDYIETDRARVTPDSPFYADVLAAHEKQNGHYAKMAAKRRET